MKKLSYVFYLVLVAVFASCTTPQDPYSNYCGSEIVEKKDAAVGKWFKFRHEGEITKRVYVMSIDWDKYNVGDTLNCN